MRLTANNNNKKRKISDQKAVHELSFGFLTAMVLLYSDTILLYSGSVLLYSGSVLLYSGSVLL